MKRSFETGYADVLVSLEASRPFAYSSIKDRFYLSGRLLCIRDAENPLRSLFKPRTKLGAFRIQTSGDSARRDFVVNSKDRSNYALDNSGYLIHPLASWIFVPCRWRLNPYYPGDRGNCRGNQARYRSRSLARIQTERASSGTAALWLGACPFGVLPGANASEPLERPAVEEGNPEIWRRKRKHRSRFGRCRTRGRGRDANRVRCIKIDFQNFFSFEQT
jgi:hypothetical protein